MWLKDKNWIYYERSKWNPMQSQIWCEIMKNGVYKVPGKL
jgi:hypothetical protein